MNDVIKIPQNVHDIQLNHEIIIGRYEQERFSIEMFNQIQDYKISSPIEQVLHSAINCVFHVNGISYNTEGISDTFQVWPQHQIDQYRVDFLIQYAKHSCEFDEMRIYKSVIVECDSQEFHDRSEKERRYEKARDRHIQKKGFKIFRFTGAEILKDSIRVACEVVSYLTDENQDDVYGAVLEFGEVE